MKDEVEFLSEDGSSTSDDGDLSDGEFEQLKVRFAALLPKYGTLWRAMVANRPSHNNPRPQEISALQCSDGCCGPVSFLPADMLAENKSGQQSPLHSQTKKQMEIIDITYSDEEDEVSIRPAADSQKSKGERDEVIDLEVESRDGRDDDEENESGTEEDDSFIEKSDDPAEEESLYESVEENEWVEEDACDIAKSESMIRDHTAHDCDVEECNENDFCKAKQDQRARKKYSGSCISMQNGGSVTPTHETAEDSNENDVWNDDLVERGSDDYASCDDGNHCNLDENARFLEPNNEAVGDSDEEVEWNDDERGDQIPCEDRVDCAFFEHEISRVPNNETEPVSRTGEEEWNYDGTGRDHEVNQEGSVDCNVSEDRAHSVAPQKEAIRNGYFDSDGSTFSTRSPQRLGNSEGENNIYQNCGVFGRPSKSLPLRETKALETQCYSETRIPIIAPLPVVEFSHEEVSGGESMLEVSINNGLPQTPFPQDLSSDKNGDCDDDSSSSDSTGSASVVWDDWKAPEPELETPLKQHQPTAEKSVLPHQSQTPGEESLFSGHEESGDEESESGNEDSSQASGGTVVVLVDSDEENEDFRLRTNHYSHLPLPASQKRNRTSSSIELNATAQTDDADHLDASKEKEWKDYSPNRNSAPSSPERKENQREDVDLLSKNEENELGTSEENELETSEENEWEDGSPDRSAVSSPPKRNTTQRHYKVLLDTSGENEWEGGSSDRNRAAASPKRNATPRCDVSLLDTSNDNERDESYGLGSGSDDDEQDHDERQMRQLLDLTNRINIHDSDSESADSGLVKRRKQTSTQKRNVRTAPSAAAFKRDRDALSQSLFREYDLKVCDGHLAKCTTVEWSNKLQTTAGLTRMQEIRGGVAPCRRAVIELSTKVLDGENRLKNTLIHEMCHAAAFIIDGVTKPPHGECFYKWANLFMKRIPGIEVTTRHDYEIQYKYAWACTAPDCNFVVKRQSRSVKVDKHICGKCRSTLMEIDMRGGPAAVDSKTPRKKAPPSAYNQFVKANSGAIRQKLQREGIKVSQSEVMKECARMWREERQEGN